VETTAPAEGNAPAAEKKAAEAPAEEATAPAAEPKAEEQS
jgi:hypothetical protein